MSRSFLTAAIVALAVSAVLVGCSSSAPSPVVTSAAPVDRTVQATIDGEWVLTRTVVASDDVNNPAHEVAAVSTRAVKFGDVVCDNGPCVGGVLSGPTASVRDQTSFSSSGNVISYTFTGYLNCVRQDTGEVLVANGYSYSSVVELRMATTVEGDESTVATLEGTMIYTDTVTDSALEAGCSREPVTATTEYALTAVRGIAEAVPAQ